MAALPSGLRSLLIQWLLAVSAWADTPEVTSELKQHLAEGQVPKIVGYWNPCVGPSKESVCWPKYETTHRAVVTFELKQLVEKGHAPKIVGEADELGNWKPSAVTAMTSDDEEGTVWRKSVMLKQNGKYEYNVAVVNNDSGETLCFMHGKNRTLTVVSDQNKGIIACQKEDIIWNKCCSSECSIINACCTGYPYLSSASNCFPNSLPPTCCTGYYI